MTGHVVDASVVVKWLVTEEFSDEAARLLEGGSTLAAPELVFAEVANALRALRRRGDVSDEDVAAAVDALKAAPLAIPFSMPQLAAAAARLAADVDHPVYDCFYLALAIQTGYPVVTADARFHDKLRAHPYLSDRILHVARAAPDGPIGGRKAAIASIRLENSKNFADESLRKPWSGRLIRANMPHGRQRRGRRAWPRNWTGAARSRTPGYSTATRRGGAIGSTNSPCR